VAAQAREITMHEKARRLYRYARYCSCSLLSALVLVQVASAAPDIDGLVQSLRDRQDELKTRMEFNDEKVLMIRDLLSSGRFYSVLITGADGPLDLRHHLGTREEAARAYRILLLQEAINLGRPYDEAELRETMREVAASANRFQADMEQEIPRLQARNRELDGEWKALEIQIAELQEVSPSPAGSAGEGPPVTIPGYDPSRCVRFAGVERLYVLGEKASISEGAGEHSVTHGGDFYGHQTSYTITWAAPPKALCSGDEVTIGMSVRGTSLPDVNRDALAAISFSGPQAGKTSCAERMKIGISWHGSAIAPAQSSHSNTCTYTMPSLSSGGGKRPIFEANMSTSPGYGKVIYYYQ
jgi:hypothetical protein